MSDLRHTCFHTTEPDDLLRRNAGNWLGVGTYDSIMYWQQDGLDRVAEWSYSMGLHVFTVGMHNSCLRLVCPWNRAREIVENIRKGNMEARMKKNEEIVAQLVQSAQRGFAVIVTGDMGCGKNWLCEMAIKKMGLTPHYINVGVLTADDLTGIPLVTRHENGRCLSTSISPGVFQKIPENAGVILDDLNHASPSIYKMLAAHICDYVRKGGRPFPGNKRVIFITLPPMLGMDELLELLGPATGETLGLERLTVEVPK